MKNRLPWVLAVIILCTAVLILSPKNVNADDEYPKITFSIDFGAGHEAFVQEIFGEREDLTISGAVVSITVESGEYDPNDLVYQIVGESDISRIDNGQWFMNAFGKVTKDNYADKDEYEYARADYYYDNLINDMTLYAYWADPLTDVTINVISPECGTEVGYEYKTGIYVWATPQPNLSISGHCHFDNYQLFYNSWDLKEYGCNSVDDPPITMTGGNSYKATGYISADWGYYISDSFGETLAVNGGELISFGGENNPSNRFVISVPVEHIVPDDAVTVEPTCTEAGSISYHCPGCEQDVVEEIEPLGHVEKEAVKENEVAPTCTEKGHYDEVVYCERCKSVVSRETVTVEALGHDWGEWTTNGELYYDVETGKDYMFFNRTCKNDKSHTEIKYAPAEESPGEPEVAVTYSPTSTEAYVYKKKNSSVNSDQIKCLTITIKASKNDSRTFDKFKSAGLKNRTMKEKKILTKGTNYNIRKGSLIIDLYEDYLDTLEAGEYVLTVEFEDGSCDVDLIIEDSEKETEDVTEETTEKQTENTTEATTEKTTEATTSQPADVSKTANPTTTVGSPKTGDETLIGMWIAIMAVSLMGAAWTMHIKKCLMEDTD